MRPQSISTSSPLSIGEVARREGVRVDTVRFYERQGLLPEPPRRASGYRQYPAESLRRLHFIRRAKALGFSLTEIKRLLSLHPTSSQACADVAAQAAEKIADLDARIRDLEAMRQGLVELAASCGRRPPLATCPLLAALGTAGEEAS